MNRPARPATYIDWPTVRDPHPSAVKNLRKFADHCIQHGITSIETSESVFKLAKALGHDYMNARKLLLDRVGFVTVEVQPTKFRVYYDLKNFGQQYPETYRDIRGREIVLHYGMHSLEDVRPESTAEPKITNRAANEIVKQIGQKFDFEPVGSDKTTLLARVPYRPLSGTNTTNDVRETILSAINSGHFDRAAIILTGIAAAVSKGDLTVID